MVSYMDYISDYMSPDSVNFDLISSEDIISEDSNDVATEGALAGKPTRAWAFVKNIINVLTKLIQDWWNKSAISKLKATLKSKIVPYAYDDQIKILTDAVKKAKDKGGKHEGGSLIPSAALMMIFSLRSDDVIAKLKAIYRMIKAVNIKQQGAQINSFVDAIGRDTVQNFKTPVFGDKALLDFNFNQITVLGAGSVASTGQTIGSLKAGAKASIETKKKMKEHNDRVQHNINAQDQYKKDVQATQNMPANTPAEQQARADATKAARDKRDAAIKGRDTNNEYDADNNRTYTPDQIREQGRKASEYAWKDYLGSQLTNNDVEKIGQGLTLVVNIYSQVITRTAWYIGRLEKDSRANPTVVLNLMKEVQSRIYAIIRTCTSMITDMNVDDGNYKEHDAQDDGADGATKPDIPQTQGASPSPQPQPQTPPPAKP